ncbi:TonB-dependent receptor [Erythrobacter sp. T5W1-R]|uniref:TonB-dependent receptor n=1 Tax=Erythrobacter sp. T5W1-R TaxID=3101752 RepID=UPI002AFE65A9|nr:TonB-dependent receptor [Erythrobacter sp. T5W1-R]MEA1617442.1 TonB-dependent receptor [Erythrobacter sp. T5W1-R]
MQQVTQRRGSWLSRTAILGIIAACGTGVPCAVFAAETAGSEVEQPAAVVEDPDGADIIVTATRRRDNLQNVAVAVTVADARALAEAQVLNIQQVAAITPSISFNITNNPASTGNLLIRGIGTNGANRALEGAAGIFVDGVYRLRPGQVLQNWLDIESLQVLRGPQGTLFGRNTTAGAVLITTAQPRLDGISGRMDSQIGNYGQRQLSGAVNLPVSDTVAVRLAAMASTIDGFVENPNNNQTYSGEDAFAVRGTVLVAPQDNLSMRLAFDYSRSDGNCCYGAVSVIPGPTRPLVDALSLANGLRPASRRVDDYELAINRNADQRLEDFGATFSLELEALGGTITSVSSWRRFDLDQRGGDLDFSGADIVTADNLFRQDSWSTELIYARDIDVLAGTDLVAGIYLDGSTIDSVRVLDFGTQAQASYDGITGRPGLFAAAPGLITDEAYRAQNASQAGFVNATVALDDRLSLILGARLSREVREGSFRDRGPALAPNHPLVFARLVPSPQYDDRFTVTAFSGTAGIKYRFSDRAMGYATYSRGFKAGGVNLDRNAAGGATNIAAPLSSIYRNEYADSYELGLKVDLADRRSRVNVALFRTDLTDLQVSQFLGLQSVVLNAPEAQVEGAELEASFALADALRFDLAGTWLPTRRFGIEPALGLLSNRDFPHAPEWAGTATLAFDQPMSEGLSISARANLQYVGPTFVSTANNARQDDYALINLRLGLNARDDTWQVAVFCQNCSDERYVTQSVNTPLQTGDAIGYIGAPRQFGIAASRQF